MRLIAVLLRRLREQAGLTIVESMVAGLVLATGIGGGYSVFITSASTEADAERHEIGTQQAERALEQMRGLDYENVKLTQAPAASTGPADPNAAVEGSQLRVKPDLLEDLVLPADPSPGTPAVTPYETFQLDSSNSPVTVKVYRYVSWRDEECPTVNLAELKDEADDARDGLEVVNQQLGDLGAPSGALDDLVDETNAALARRPLASGLLTQLTSALTPVVPGAGALNKVVDEIKGPLDDVEGPVAELADSNLTGTADLCDMDPRTLRRIRHLKTLNLLLGEVGPALADVQAAVAAIRVKVQAIRDAPLVGLPVSNTLPFVVTNALLTLPGLVNDFGTDRVELNDAIEAAMADASPPFELELPSDPTQLGADDLDPLGEYLGTMATELTAAIESILNAEDTTHNTKRLTVAVVLDTQQGAKPPVWVSSVVSDPEDGLASD